MEQFIGIAERFGLPVVMLLGMSYALVQLFKWLANDLMRQLQNNADRIEKLLSHLLIILKKKGNKIGSILTKSSKDWIPLLMFFVNLME